MKNLPDNIKVVKATTTLEYAVEGLALKLTEEAGGLELQVTPEYFNECLYAIVRPDQGCVMGAYKTLIELEAATDVLDYFSYDYEVYEVISAETAGY